MLHHLYNNRDDDNDDDAQHDDDYYHENDDDDLPGPATSVRTVRVAEEFPSCLLVNAFAQIVYFLYGSKHFILMVIIIIMIIIIIIIIMRTVRYILITEITSNIKQKFHHSPRS